MAYEAPLKIVDVVNDIHSNKYILPAIQREFIWDVDQIEQLFDSLMQGYPIGAFLFWEVTKKNYRKYEFYSFLQNYHERDARHNPKTNIGARDSVMAVLDGQQRLTSIYVGLTGTYAYKLPYRKRKSETAYPKRKLYLNIVAPSEEEDKLYDFLFLTPEEADNDANEDQETFWFEVGKILEMKEPGDVTEYLMDNIAYNDKFTKDQGKFANKTLSQLYNVVHTQPVISYYKVKTDELDKVLNIFIRVNSGGTPLSYSDLLLSIATAQWETLDAREEITEFVDELNNIGGGFNVNKDFVLKSALVLSDFTKIAFKVDNFGKANMLKIEEKWDTIKKALYSAYTLVASFGLNRDSLKSNNAVIPIAYYLMIKGFPRNFEIATAFAKDRKIIKKWLIMSLIKRIFSGQPDNVLRQLRDVIAKNKENDLFPLEAIIRKLRGTPKTILFNDDDIEALLDLQYGKADTITALMLLYPALDFNNKFHVDHIYPKSKFTKKTLERKGVDSVAIPEYMRQVNNIANLQLLPAIPNIEKQDKDFDLWFNEINTTEKEKIQYREMHYLPEIEYSYANFIKFTEERRELIKKQLETMLLM